jgi:hypothetical protein
MASGTDFDLSNEYAFEKSAPAPLTSATNSFGEERVRYKYQPPEFVRKRLFCSMAEYYGFEDAMEFALVLEGWSEQRKTDCLDRFYRHRRKVLEGEGGSSGED